MDLLSFEFLRGVLLRLLLLRWGDVCQLPFPHMLCLLYRYCNYSYNFLPIFYDQIINFDHQLQLLPISLLIIIYTVYSLFSTGIVMRLCSNRQLRYCMNRQHSNILCSNRQHSCVQYDNIRIYRIFVRIEYWPKKQCLFDCQENVRKIQEKKAESSGNEWIKGAFSFLSNEINRLCQAKHKKQVRLFFLVNLVAKYLFCSLNVPVQ